MLMTYAGAVAAYHAKADRWSPRPPHRQAAAVMFTLSIVLILAAGTLAVRADGWWAGLGVVLCTLMLAGVIVCSLAPVRPASARVSGLLALAAVVPSNLIG